MGFYCVKAPISIHPLFKDISSSFDRFLFAKNTHAQKAHMIFAWSLLITYWMLYL